MALVQKDIKSLVAYSSVSHMGLIMLAVFALNVEAVQGAVFQMLNHGLSTGAAVPLRRHPLRAGPHPADRRLRRRRPGRCPSSPAFFLVAILSSVGLPGLNGFVGEILCFYGIFAANQPAGGARP